LWNRDPGSFFAAKKDPGSFSLTLALTLATLARAARPDAALPLVVCDRDNLEITSSCRVRFAEAPIADADGNGVVHVAAEGATLEFEGRLRGSPPGAAPDTYAGTGIRVTAGSVTVRWAQVSGFKCGLHATGSASLLVEDCDFSDNYRARLRSTPAAEDSADWLRPHANDANEWLDACGAGLYVEDGDLATIRRVRARGTQNGIVLDRVNSSSVYDCDCSFGSGWGIALWRSSGNTICRNACDFRVRGYSHGVYNRGQDSAGILMFEQCSLNVIAANSATHCGDGLFAFAGHEALGEAGERREREWYLERGANRNVIADNDFSYAAAHGLELTFSFNNCILRNRLAGNAICGIWAGYSQQTFIAANAIESNGDMPSGAERGGINIEHGYANFIYRNAFRDNACGVFLWWDRDPAIAKLPWADANPTAAEENTLVENTFEGDAVAVELRQVGPTSLIANRMTGVGADVDADKGSRAVLTMIESMDMGRMPMEEPSCPGETSPVGARAALAGRDRIVMTEWGPYDHESGGPLLRSAGSAPGRRVYELLGGAEPEGAAIEAPPGVALARDGRRFELRAEAPGRALPYTLTVTAGGRTLAQRGVLVTASWDVRFFASAADPREDEAAWRAGSGRPGARCALPGLVLRFGNGGPGTLVGACPEAGDLPADRFGTIAEATITFPPGHWRLETVSDDGLRVWLDGALVIDDWTWHAPTAHAHEFSVEAERAIPIRVEHFELDGHAVLTLAIEPG
jgi:parallel beta-helix repeat protein